ncbi:MAG: sigma-70 family RNA polymerase sigma factor [Thermodesulfobacteriota bacterium]
MGQILKPKLPSDEALVARVKEGDETALNTLYERYMEKVYFRIGGQVPRQDVEDVTQEVFLALVRSLTTFRAACSFSTWVNSLINKKVADYYRRKYSRKEVNWGYGEQGQRHHQPAREKEVMVKEILHRLPKHYREVILERLAEGMSFKEVADSMDYSLEAAKSLYRRALDAFRKEWGEI